MPILKHHALITIAGIRDWQDQSVPFQVRYDLVKPAHKYASPGYNCIYLQGDYEYVLVASNTRKDGSVEERILHLWAGILKKHHREFGDGSCLVFDSDRETITTWLPEPDGRLRLSTQGKNLVEEDAVGQSDSE